MCAARESAQATLLRCLVVIALGVTLAGSNLSSAGAGSGGGSRKGTAKCMQLAVTISGSNAKDTILGTSGDDVISSLGGRDAVFGMGGNDTICAGSGDDAVSGGDGDDLIASSDGDDGIVGGPGKDTVSYGDAPAGVYVDLRKHESWDGANGHDTVGEVEDLIGSDYRDVLRGGMEDNLLRGGLGNDDLYGGGGVDILDGGFVGERNFCLYDADDTVYNCG